MKLDQRMKEYYEEAYKIKLPMRMPVILRIDGRHFHSWTKQVGLQVPFDDQFIENINAATLDLCREIGCTVFGYTQSDEISILIHNYKKLDSQSWFGNELQKIVSVSAAFMSSWFTLKYKLLTQFDARAFVLPEDEVANYFVWRQEDAIRNSVSMMAQSFYSHKELHGKKRTELLDLIRDGGENWEDLPKSRMRGTAIYRSENSWVKDFSIPEFKNDREFIEKHFLPKGGVNDA